MFNLKKLTSAVTHEVYRHIKASTQFYWDISRIHEYNKYKELDQQRRAQAINSVHDCCRINRYFLSYSSKRLVQNMSKEAAPSPNCKQICKRHCFMHVCIVLSIVLSIVLYIVLCIVLFCCGVP